MDLDKVSPNGLIKLHGAIREALAADDQTPQGQPKLYEVRELPDWRRWADDLEAAMTRREIKHEKISWQ